MKINLYISALLIILATSLGFNDVYAQSWFPEGATWTYAYHDNTKNTTHRAKIGVIAQELHDNHLISTIDIRSDDGAGFAVCQAMSFPIYVYAANDAIYFASAADSTYKLAMRTDAVANDQWTIIGKGAGGPDSNRVHVESVGSVSHAQKDLKKWSLSVDRSELPAQFAIPRRVDLLEFAGSLSSVLFPLGTLSGCDAVSEVQLLCYDGGSVRYVSPETDGCTVAQKSIGAWSPLLIFPNPNNNLGVVRVAGMPERVLVYDAQGWAPIDINAPVINTREMGLSPITFGVNILGF